MSREKLAFGRTEGLRKVRNATVFEFGYYRGSSGSGLFRRHPQSLSTLQTSVRGPSFPHPLSLRSYLPPAGGIVQLEIPGWTMAVACLCGAPNNSINFQSRFCVPMPLTLSIGSKLGIYAAPAEIPPRPDGGLPGQGPRHLLHRPRWRILVGCIVNTPPPSPGNIIYPGARASNLCLPELTAEITIAAK
jgi:hypothetical protein